MDFLESLFAILTPALLGYLFARYSSLLDKHENYKSDLISRIRRDYDEYYYSIGMINTLVKKYIADSKLGNHYPTTGDFIIFKEHFLNATSKSTSLTFTKEEIVDKFSNNELNSLMDSMTNILFENVDKLNAINEIVFSSLKPNLNVQEREELEYNNVNLNDTSAEILLSIISKLRSIPHEIFLDQD